jgi:hypothetical protein
VDFFEAFVTCLNSTVIVSEPGFEDPGVDGFCVDGHPREQFSANSVSHRAAQLSGISIWPVWIDFRIAKF